MTSHASRRSGALARGVFGTALGAVALAAFAAPAGALDPGRALTQYTRQVWSIDEGLPQSSVYAVLPSAAGDLWIGTGEGLVRFDGFEFSVFDSGNTPELVNNHVNRLLETADGSLWIGTQGGLVRRRGGRFERMAPESGLPLDTVYALALDGRARLWVGTAHGLFVRDGDRFAPSPLLPARNEVRAILADGETGLWVGTGKGLFRLDGDAVERFGEEDGLAGGAIFSLGRRRNGTLVVGTLRGAALRAGRQFVPIEGSEEVGLAMSLLEDRDGSLWVGGFDGLFRRGADERTSRMSTAEGLPYEATMALAEDAEGNFWVGTDGGGLARFADGRFVPVGAPEGLPTDMVWTVIEDRSGALWVGTDGAGVARRGPRGEWRRFGRADGLPGGAVYALFEDGAGRIWVGADGGAAFIEGDRVTAIVGDSAQLVRAVFSFAQMDDGAVLAGTQGHVVRIADGVARAWEAHLGLEAFTGVAAAMYRAREGSLWVGTNGAGIRRLRPDGQLDRFGPEQGLAPGFLIDFFEDPDGTLWVASDNGLYRFAGGRFALLDRTKGLPTDRVFEILLDDRDRFWLPTNKGVAVISRAQAIETLEGKRERVPARLLGRVDGLRSPECNGGKPGGFKDARGRIWIPTTAGLAAIDPRTLDLATPAPRVRIESVTTDKRALDPTREGELGVGERSLEIAWTAPTFVAPERVRFRYRVDGIEGGWVETAARRARLDRLPPGRSRFVVEAAGEDGRWSDSAGYGFDVVPRFSETAAFFWLTGGSLALGGLAVARVVERYRRRQLERRHQELEVQVALRTRELRSANEALEQHEAELVALNQQLLDLSYQDPLTGVANRRRFDSTLDAELHRAHRFANPVALVLLDVDEFKAYNDHYGHPAGDACLRRLAALLTATVARAGDLVARYGGEEFAAILPGTSREGAERVAENLRHMVEELGVPHEAAPRGYVTVSLGVSVYDAQSEPDAAGLVDAVDRALYRAKAAGRNRVEIDGG